MDVGSSGLDRILLGRVRREACSLPVSLDVLPHSRSGDRTDLRVLSMAGWGRQGPLQGSLGAWVLAQCRGTC